MLTRCPYLACQNIFEVESEDKVKSYLFNAICPRCEQLGRIKSLDIAEKLKARESLISSLDNIFLTISQNRSAQFIVLLEDIRSLWNVGSVFRTADAIGICQLYLSGITGCPPRTEITKTALGAEKFLPWQYIYNPLDIISVLKKAAVTVVGLERTNSSLPLLQLLKAKTITKPLCLVIGNENAGLSPETIANCHYICDLPMKGQKESLNVASAFAVAAYFIDEFI